MTIEGLIYFYRENQGNTLDWLLNFKFNLKRKAKMYSAELWETEGACIIDLRFFFLIRKVER